MLAYKTMPGTKNFKKAVHLSILFLSLCLATIGLWAAIKFHNEKGIENFYSLHSWLGLAALISFAIQVSHHLCGVAIIILFMMLTINVIIIISASWLR